MKKSGNIFLILLLALVMRIVAAGFTCPISADGATYIGFSRSLMEGEYFVPLAGYRCFLYPLAIVALAPFTPEMVIAGQAVSVIMGVLVVLFVYLFGKEIFDERVAMSAALLGAVQPYMVKYSGDVLTEATYTFFLLLAAFIGLRAIGTKKMEDFTRFGLSATLAYLSKPEGLAIVPFLWAWIFLGVRKVSFWKKLAMAAVSAVFVVLILATQMYFYYLLTERLTLSEKFMGSVRLGQVEDAEEMFYDPRGELASEYTPPYFDISYYGGVVVSFLELLVNLGEAAPVVLPLLLLGLLYCLARGFSRKDAYIASIVLFYIVGFSFIRSSRRFLIPLLPFFLFWAAMGLNTLRDIVSRKWKGALTAGIVGLMLILSLRQVAWPECRWRWSPEERAGLWLKAHSSPHPRIVSRKGWVSFYAEGERIVLPLTYEDLIKLARAAGADYFEFRRSRLMRKRPGMIDKIDPADMELVHTEADGDDAILIYRFRKDEGARGE